MTFSFIAITSIVVATSVFLIGSAQAASAKKCEINLEGKSTNGYGSNVFGSYPTVLTMTKEDCFNRALQIATELGDVEGESIDTTRLKTRGNTIYWRKVISWTFNDRIAFASSGKVTSYSRTCMDKVNDGEVTGDKLFWRNCELF